MTYKFSHPVGCMVVANVQFWILAEVIYIKISLRSHLHSANCCCCHCHMIQLLC